MDNKTTDRLYSLVDLFKAVPMGVFHREPRMVSAYQCLQDGFVVVTKGGNLVETVPGSLYDIIDELYGTDVAAFNNTFHKSFATVANMTPAQYCMEQFMHYLSTYGRESFGLKAIPYIPTEELQIPQVNFTTDKIIIITAMETYEIIDLVDDFARNTVAPSSRIVERFTNLLDMVTIDPDEIRSFELRVIKYDRDNTVSPRPDVALRYLVYKATGQTLLIKNRDLISRIKNSNLSSAEVQRIFNALPAPVWARIFFRYKPLFLAFKATYPDCRAKINYIRRLADTYHTPEDEINVKNFTKMFYEDRTEEINAILEKATNRELVKLINVLGGSLGGNNVGVYNIRNGRIFVNAEAKVRNISKQKTAQMLEKICTILHNRLEGSLKGKTFYLPEYIDYAAPYSEKQFIGNLPWGSIITMPDHAFTVGIQWFDVNGVHTDLDLHMNAVDAHFGWNGSIHNNDEIIYTGDMTAAPYPNGAAEAFWFTPRLEDKFLLSVNKFHSADAPTPFKFAVSLKKPDKTLRYTQTQNNHYTFDNPVFAPIPLKFEKDASQMNLGMFIGNTFYFYGGQLTGGIVPSKDYKNYIDGMADKLESQIRISEILDIAGAKVITSLDGLSDEEREAVVDLAPEALTAHTLLDIIDAK